MESCAGIDCGQKRLREDAKLWSTSLKELLASNDGRKMFEDFLSDCGLENELTTLCFWERCNDVVCEHQQLKKTASSAGTYSSSETSKFISNAASVYEEFVDGCQVNVDEQMKARLDDAVQSKDPDKIAEVFQEAKSCAHNLLKEYHSMFAKELIKEYKLS